MLGDGGGGNGRADRDNALPARSDLPDLAGPHSTMPCNIGSVACQCIARRFSHSLAVLCVFRWISWFSGHWSPLSVLSEVDLAGLLKKLEQSSGPDAKRFAIAKLRPKLAATLCQAPQPTPF